MDGTGVARHLLALVQWYFRLLRRLDISCCYKGGLYAGASPHYACRISTARLLLTPSPGERAAERQNSCWYVLPLHALLPLLCGAFGDMVLILPHQQAWAAVFGRWTANGSARLPCACFLKHTACARPGRRLFTLARALPAGLLLEDAGAPLNIAASSGRAYLAPPQRERETSCLYLFSSFDRQTHGPFTGYSLRQRAHGARVRA